ncbi:MAG TPA: sugar ABC transporter substrate-binding protein [Paenibacillus sp.]
MKGRGLLFVLILLFTVMVSACGSPAAGVPMEQNVSNDSSVNQKQEPVKLKYTFWGSPNEKKVQEAAIKAFTKKYPWITVDTLHIPADYTTKLTTMAASGQTPDVGLLNGDLSLQWAEEGRLLNIMDFLQDDPEIQLDDILPNTLYWWGKGKLAGINGALEAFALFYNKKAFEEANIPLPPTKPEEAYDWEQFVEVLQKLTIDQQGRNALDPAFNANQIKQFGISLPLWAYMNAVVTNGGQFVNEDGTQFKLTDPEAVEAIQRWADLINKYHVAPSPSQSKNLPGGAAALQSRKVAMTLDGQWSLVDLSVTKKMDFGIGVPPVMKINATMTLGDPIVIFKETKHPEEAWMLLKWMMNPENTLELQTSGLWMPVLKKWYDKPELVAKWAAGNPAHPEGYQDAVMRNSFENGFQSTTYYVKNLAKINNVLDPALEQVWFGKTTAAEALEKVKVKLEKELKGVYTPQ